MESIDKILSQENKKTLKKHISDLVDTANIGSSFDLQKIKIRGGCYGCFFDEKLTHKIARLFQNIPYINHYDVEMICERILLKISESKPPAEKKVLVKELLDSNQMANAEKALYEYFLSLPFEYEVLFPLMYFPLIHKIEGDEGEGWIDDASDQVFEITDDIRIFYVGEQHRQNQYPAIVGYEIFDESWHGAHISIKTYGCDIIAPASASFLNAIKKLKILVSTLVIYEILKISTSPTLYHFHEYGSHCYVYPRFLDGLPQSIRMNYQESNFISQLVLNHNKVFKPNRFEELLINQGKKEDTLAADLERLRKRLQPVQELFASQPSYSADKNGDVERINTALLWFFDGLANSNMSFSFVQLSIALEALIGGEKDVNDPVTRRLADRCAFLIGKSNEKRKETSEKLKEAYGARSDIIHKGEVELDEKNTTRYKNMKQILTDLLRIEINNLTENNKNIEDAHIVEELGLALDI